jgi:hypothetical protein
MTEIINLRMERIMFKRKIKNFTAISMIALSLGVSSASAAGGKVASGEATEFGKALAIKKYSPAAEVSVSESNQKIIFSVEWLKSLTLEEIEAIDFSQVNFSEFMRSVMKAEKETKIGLSNTYRVLKAALAAPNSDLVDGKEMVHPTQELLKNPSGSMKWLDGLTEAEIDKLKSFIGMHKLSKYLQNKADHINRYAINYSQMKPKSNNIELETEKSNV